MTDEQKQINFEQLKKSAERQAKVLAGEIEGMIDLSLRGDLVAIYSYGLISNEQLEELLEIVGFVV